MVHQFGNFGGEPEVRSTRRRVFVSVHDWAVKKVDSPMPLQQSPILALAQSPGFQPWSVDVRVATRCRSTSTSADTRYGGWSGMIWSGDTAQFRCPLRSKSIVEFWQAMAHYAAQFITVSVHADLEVVARATLFTAAWRRFWR